MLSIAYQEKEGQEVSVWFMLLLYLLDNGIHVLVEKPANLKVWESFGGFLFNLENIKQKY
jgi:hypothetical protein